MITKTWCSNYSNSKKILNIAIFLLSTLLILFLVPTPSFATEDPSDVDTKRGKYSIKEQRKLRLVEKQLKKSTESTNTHCRASITSSVNWESFHGAEWNHVLVGNLCADTLAAIRHLCKEDFAKKAITAAIQSYTCSYAGNTNRSIELTEGKLQLNVNSKEKNYAAYVKQWLEENL